MTILNPGLHFSMMTIYPGIAIFIIKIRSLNSLIFIMGILFYLCNENLYTVKMTPLCSDICMFLTGTKHGLTHWGRVTHICVSKLSILGSDNGFSPGRRQAIIWTNAWLLIGPLGTNFSEILIEIHTFSFKKMHLKMSSGKWQPFVSASMY